ncbi:hypothetical protein [Caulobacter sp. DWR1-3-2b1]|uniref:hypothetical protein n=1 Tax=Caulobacter sp. DWR1-3-2b1 TaxID=2804670 RepID=UPI003CFA3986
MIDLALNGLCGEMAGSTLEHQMDSTVMLGALIGSALFIALGRAPAERLIAELQRSAKRRR